MENKNIILVLITGYARSGKTTLGNSICTRLKAQGKRCYHINFADSLKYACDMFFEHLDLKVDLSYNVSDKLKYRDFLVTCGKLARSINSTVFIEKLFNKVYNASKGEPLTYIVVSDWRYLNEYTYLKETMSNAQIITIRMNCPDVEAANVEEGLSIGEITREIPMDHDYSFTWGWENVIKLMGESLADKLASYGDQ